MSRAWYSYTAGQPIDQVDSYLLILLTPYATSGRTLRCIYAPADPFSSHPAAVTQRLLYYITDGMTSGGPTPKSPVGAKKYVYFYP